MLHAFDPKTIQRMSFEEPAAVQETKTRETTTKTRETTTKTRETTTRETEEEKVRERTIRHDVVIETDER